MEENIFCNSQPLKCDSSSYDSANKHTMKKHVTSNHKREKPKATSRTALEHAKNGIFVYGIFLLCVLLKSAFN